MNIAEKRYLLGPFLIAFALSAFVSGTILKAQDTAPTIPSTIAWETERIEMGIYWKKYKGDELFDSRQSINLVEMFLDSITAEFKIAYLEDQLIRTSDFATRNNALIAVNGSFFNRESGGSVVFLKADGAVIHEGHTNSNPFNEQGAVAWSGNQPIRILKKPEDGWITSQYDNILSSGPLLIFESKIQAFSNNSFHQNRHPRTAVAITNDRRLFLVTIDGRSFQAYGMSISELANFLQNLGAQDALNLDGGGSTSMWIENMTDNGIVNYPSDNLEFDHTGERNVANALLILLSDS